jgi:hypothetical protein
MVKTATKTEEKWWKRPPRSSRICLRCNHKYSSHIDVRCLKIVQKKPERLECTCRGFVANKAELEMIQQREKNKLLNDKEDT